MAEETVRYLESIGCGVTRNAPLKSLSSMRIDAYADALIFPDNSEKITRALEMLQNSSARFMVTGRMSNILIANGFYNGVIVNTREFRTKRVAENKIELSCGIAPASLYAEFSKKCIGGFEGLYGIPGTVGGMIKQNAGAYGYEISDNIIEAEVFDLSLGKTVNMGKESMGLSYRKSVFDRNLVILTTIFLRKYKSQDAIFSETKKYGSMRRSSQPTDEYSLGCVFKKAGGLSAGYYIDKAGLKGVRKGGARISEKHAGFIVNDGSATADDILWLIEYAKECVLKEFGVELETEIEII